MTVGPILGAVMRDRHQQSQPEFVDVFHPRNSHEAGLVRECLKRNGITCYINNESFFGISGAILGIGPYTMRVMVPRSATAKARELIRELFVDGGEGVVSPQNKE